MHERVLKGLTHSKQHDLVTIAMTVLSTDSYTKDTFTYEIHLLSSLCQQLFASIMH